MKRITIAAVTLCMLVALASCRSIYDTHRGFRKDDPYLYKRGPWNFSKGGIFDDIPQFVWQMLESMFDYGTQPVDPPSEYEPEESYASTPSNGPPEEYILIEQPGQPEPSWESISTGQPEPRVEPQAPSEQGGSSMP